MLSFSNFVILNKLLDFSDPYFSPYTGALYSLFILIFSLQQNNGFNMIFSCVSLYFIHIHPHHYNYPPLFSLLTPGGPIPFPKFPPSVLIIYNIKINKIDPDSTYE